MAVLAAATARSHESVNYREILKRAVIAGVVTLVLASLMVGVQTTNTMNYAIGIETRFRAVFMAAAGVAVIFFLVELMRLGRALPALLGGLTPG